jgi:DnaA family protein
MTMPKQRVFTFPSKDETRFESFYPGKNHVLLQLLKNFSEQSDIFCAYLWGGTGTGKTHLLQAACYEKNHHTCQSAAYLPLTHLRKSSPKLLKKLESLSLICLDDIEAISQNPRWEEALFHFYNSVQANHGRLLLSSAISPQNLLIQLPDLKSRITASFIIEIKPLSDEEKLAILRTRAQSRGFDLSEEATEFLITHFPRDMKKLMDILNQLDEASLVEKRRVTIPLIKQVARF